MAKAKENKDLTVEEKLKALFELQMVDSKIDDIKRLRGELPLEVQDLEDEIEGLQTRIQNHEDDLAKLETLTGTKLIEALKSLSKDPKVTKAPLQVAMCDVAYLSLANKSGLKGRGGAGFPRCH